MTTAKSKATHSERAMNGDRDEGGRFRKGHAPTPGAGRPKGAKDKVPAAVKSMVLTAVDLMGRAAVLDEDWLNAFPEELRDEIRELDGGTLYLLRQAAERPQDVNQMLKQLIPREHALEDETRNSLEDLLARARERARERGPESEN